MNLLAHWINLALKPLGIKISRIKSNLFSNVENEIEAKFEVREIVKEVQIIKEVIREVENFFPPETWVMTEFSNGSKLWIDLGDTGVSQACLKNQFEPQETVLVRRLLKPGQIFLDIGANIGWFSVVAAEIVGVEGKVFSFEPRNTTFHYLQKTVIANKFEDRFNLFNFALGEKEDTLRIVWGTNTNNPGGTWLVSSASVSDLLPTTTHTYQDILVKKLDDINEIQQVDFIKIDVEGAEPLVLRGAENLLLKSRPIILAEINEELLKIVGNSTSKTFINWMKSLDFQCLYLPEQSIDQPAIWKVLDVNNLPPVVNVVFVPSEKMNILM